MARVFLALLSAFALAGCSGGSRQPVTPTPPPVIEVPAAPIARFAVRVDDGAAVAISASSTVTFDATTSSGSGLRYSIDFGDGGGVDAPTATHVYRDIRTFRARVIVTDSLGRTDTSSTEVRVVGVEGLYNDYFFNQSANRWENRYLRLVRQSGTEIDGVYTHPEGFTSSFRGQVVPGRGAVLTLTSGTITFDGTPPNGFNSSADTLQVLVKGGSANGMIRPFRRSTF